MSQANLIYAAGLFDGEGCIGIAVKNRTRSAMHAPWAKVTMTHEAIIHWLKATFGGRIAKRTPTNPKWSPSYTWLLEARAAVDFIRAVRPYLRVKGPQADLLIEYGATIPMPGQNISINVKRERERIRRAISACNDTRGAFKPFEVEGVEAVHARDHAA